MSWLISTQPKVLRTLKNKGRGPYKWGIFTFTDPASPTCVRPVPYRRGITVEMHHRNANARMQYFKKRILYGPQADVGFFMVCHRLRKSTVGHNLLLCNKNNKTRFPTVGLGQARFVNTFHIFKWPIDGQCICCDMVFLIWDRLTSAKCWKCDWLSDKTVALSQAEFYHSCMSNFELFVSSKRQSTVEM